MTMKRVVGACLLLLVTVCVAQPKLVSREMSALQEEIEPPELLAPQEAVDPMEDLDAQDELESVYNHLLHNAMTAHHKIHQHKLNMWQTFARHASSLHLNQILQAIPGLPDKSYNVSAQCLKDIEMTMEATVAALNGSADQGWALQMLDAAGKPTSGILKGATLWLGDYDQCLSVRAVAHGGDVTKPTFKGQHCLVSIGNKKTAKPSPMGMAPGTGLLYTGFCIPSTCDYQDALDLVNTLLFELPQDIEALTAKCSVDEADPLNTRSIAYLSVLAVLTFFLIAGTAYDIIIHQPRQRSSSIPNVVNSYMSENSEVSENDERGLLGTTIIAAEPNVFAKLLLAMSVYTNGAKILAVEQNEGSLDAIHGVRFLSMTWVILGHTYVFSISSWKNLYSLLPMLDRWTFRAIANATVSVDSFFLMSGLLMTYLSLREMKRVGGPRHFKWHLFYFHRFWRLTPPYMLVLGFYVTLANFMGDGPLFPEDTFDPNCLSNWWTNLLYVNNLVNQKKQCMGWAWYLANDMQFFVISPLFLIPLYWSGILGVLVCGGVLLISWIVTGVRVSQLHIGASILTQTQGDSFDNYYIVPWTRIGPYIIGVLVGYVLYRTDRKIKLHWAVSLCCWLAAAAMSLAVLYGLNNSMTAPPPSQLASSFYDALARSAWAIGLGWVLFACITGNGGFVNTLLSWPGLVPLSRLTYMAYLVHPMVMMWFILQTKSTMYLTDAAIVTHFLGFLVASYGVAYIGSVAFEAPMIGLEKVILKRK